MTTNIESVDDERIVAKCYVELGNVTKEKGEYDESLRYHRKSMEIFERIDDALSVADSHLNIAEVYKAKGELKRAMSEYEKGLNLYEDVYVEDGNKNSDSGTDVSLNSSSFSDLQHTKSLSKSDETLPQATLIDTVEKDMPLPSLLHPLNDGINTSTSSGNLFVSPTKKSNEFDGLPHSIDDSFLIASGKVSSEPRKSLSASSMSDLQHINADDVFLSSTPNNFAGETTGESTPEESEILEICMPFLPPIQSIDQDPPQLTVEPSSLGNKLEENNNENQSTDVQENVTSNNTKQVDVTPRFRYRLPNKRYLIILLSLFLAGVLFWSFNIIPIQSLLSCSSIDSPIRDKSHPHTPGDLTVQLRKILTWRKDRWTSLSKDHRRTIEEFLTNSDSQSKMTLEKFQRILDMLDLKIVLIPQ